MGFFLAGWHTMESDDNTLGSLLEGIADLMHRFPRALEQRAAEIQASGKDPELADKLAQGASAMRDSGTIYIAWARHYASLASREDRCRPG